MQKYVRLTDESRIGCTSSNADYGDLLFNFSEDFDFEHQSDYKITDGTILYDPIPVPAPEPSPQEQTDTLMLDHEERLIYLELGVNDNAVSGS